MAAVGRVYPPRGPRGVYGQVVPHRDPVGMPSVAGWAEG